MYLRRLLPTALVGLLLLSTSHAATITVSTTADQFNGGGPCSIREALDRMRLAANGRGCTATGAYGTNDTIIIPAGTYSLTLTGAVSRATLDLDVESNVTLQGAGGNSASTVINAGALGGAVQADTNVIEAAAGVTAVFNDIQFQGGRTDGDYRGRVYTTTPEV